MARMNFGGQGQIKRSQDEIAADVAARVDQVQAKYPRGAAGVQMKISDMAKIMVDRRNANDNCTTEDLKREGFTDQDIAEFGDRARARARRLCRDIAA
ncbi:hypothetical protein [Dongia sp.]|uniref:hypothetical protein n=1 Tax=Dongia sp. TaxID=1977262 RepID=UPI0035B21BDC